MHAVLHNPRMLLNVLQCNSLLRIEDKELKECQQMDTTAHCRTYTHTLLIRSLASALTNAGTDMSHLAIFR